MSAATKISGIPPIPRPQRRLSVRLAMFGAAAAIAIAVTGAISVGALRSGIKEREYETETVKRAPLEVRITERGNVESSNNLTLRCLVESGTGTSILKIAEEGAHVRKDEVVVELDSARLRDEASVEVIKLRSAEAALKNAEADLEIQKMQNGSDIAAAELKLELAQLDLKKYEEGEYVQQRNVILGEIKMAAEYLTRAVERKSFTARLMRRGFTTTKVMDAERVAVAKATIDLDSAVEKKKVLESYSHKRDLAELKSNAANFQRELERVKLRAEKALTQREVNLLARRRSCFLQRQRYEKLLQQIEACTIRTPREGMVVYANRPENHREPLIYEGALVRERQPVIYLPDLASMQVIARVHESKVALLREGQTATIHVDAHSGESFHGVVEEVAAVPDSAKWPNVNLKEYTTRLKITDEVELTKTLKPGMTAGVDILVEQMASALQVPIQSCVERGGRYFAWVLEGEDEVERREVKLGLSNDTTSEVLTGLAEGDEVVLNPRKALPQQIALLESQIRPAATGQFEGIRLPEDADDEPDDPAGPYELPPVPAAPPLATAAPARDTAIGPLAVLPSTEIEKRRADEQAPARDPMAAFNWLDQNHDSKVSESELPDPMKPMLSQIDTNHDHAIDKTEWNEAARGQQHKSELRRAGGGGN